MKCFVAAFLLLGGLLVAAGSNAADCLNATAYSTPASTTCTIPAGVTSVTVVVIGAGGGGGYGAAGGNGAQLTNILSVTAGQTMNMDIGGGGAGYFSLGGGGGGSTNLNAGTADQIIAGGAGAGGWGKGCGVNAIATR